MADRVGQQLGNYRLLRLLGEGGFADVYLAEHVHLGAEAAIKVLHTRVTSDDLETFRAEARTIARLIHPNIVSVLDFGVEGGIPFLVMRYAPHGTLRQRLPKGVPLPPATIVPYIKQVAEALQYAHEQRLIHRDVKPENMLLGANNEVLLSDFGIALLTHSSRSQPTQEAAGTVSYMAPEQLQGKPRPASDQYALGVVAYEWLTGSRPFSGSFSEIASQHLFAPPTPLREKVPAIPPDVEQVVLTALTKDPQQRFGNVRAFATALEQASRTPGTMLFAPTQVSPSPAPTPTPAQPDSQPGGALYFAPAQMGTPPTPGASPSQQANQQAGSIYFAPTQMGTPPQPAAPAPGIATPPHPPAGRAGALPAGSPATPPGPFTAFAPPPGGNAGPPPSGPGGPGGWPPGGMNPAVGPLAPIPVPPRRRGFMLLLALLAVVVLVGGGVGLAFWAHNGGNSPLTGNPPATRPVGTTPTPQIKRGGTVTDGILQDPDSLLPNGTGETFGVLVDATIWAPLLYGDAQGNLQPGLLSEVPTVGNGDISADARHYTLKLRPDLKWSDGQPLTADDVVFTLNLWNTPAYGAITDTAGLPFIDFSTLRATDATTVTFAMKQAYVPLLAQQLTDPALAPMPKHVFGAMAPASILKSAQNFQPTVVSGPFQLSERVRGDHITVVRNPNYYQAAQGLPYLDQIVFEIITNSGTLLTALQSNSIDTAWSLDTTKLESYKAIAGYTVSTSKNPGTFEEALFNLHNPILSDLQVRKAISMSIDLDSIISVVLKNTGQRTCDEAVGSFAHNPSQTCYTFDPTSAGQILDADGWTLGADGYRHKQGQILELRWSTIANSARHQQTEAIAQANLKAIGIKIDVVNYDAATLFGNTLPSGNFDIGEFANSLGYDPDNGSFWLCNQAAAQGGLNWGFYCNPAADQALHTEETNPDQNARLAAFKTFQQAILTDLPVEYLYTYSAVAIARNTIHNYTPSDLGPSETWNVWQWWKD